jgi:hypothetical protein
VPNYRATETTERNKEGETKQKEDKQLSRTGGSENRTRGNSEIVETAVQKTHNTITARKKKPNDNTHDKEMRGRRQLWTHGQIHGPTAIGTQRSTFDCGGNDNNNNNNYEYYNDNTTTAAVTHFRAKTHITNT